MSKHQLSLEESQILFFTELIALMYCSAVRKACQMFIQSDVPIGPLFLEGALRENLRALLREPLRNPFFREKFNRYFRTHEHPDIRNVAYEWMGEILVWES
ncbi:MAG: hypothetical protein WC814_01845 [Candidatus Paceibacterota bacterium]